ncbi:DnaJ homolog subfamily C member 17 [Morus notabilis]|uniref:DnaJ homolog subfamily C member 17 n=2 Tax=Morus notabilis TaxID=981085 RepID=W9QWU0_9ROSA|nr:dnaJ homolog subfamily C member 17 isoform X2 [Morus notabilis]XP_024033028.1 dnaJ homolog subfamily C member 17 isoform X2 [Morus notabilis]XP_024033033.1 dnaJ homolog subfamily C member 17 isoform X2 [Morus notabilis]XP_024033036.1 dnaJ homolog subfamily C member 17 isoform X2 [Morus notabilis]XP_024033041.1 dnaJ homolog subfamily C member 17 isoform X2 [Morus notabilis]EXB24032.1 DnaJ homolog subfamily C member 17 [Morus notabilis]
MDIDVDHYSVLGLPSGEEGAKLTEKEISKAYRIKALELHPDKRPDDPNAHENFQRLKTSYEILKDEKARKLFDDLLKVKREQQRRHSERDARKRKMVSDLEERERAAFAPDPAAREREEEERIAKKLKEEIVRIRAMHANKGAAAASVPKMENGKVGKESESIGAVKLDKERILKVSWEKVGEGYTAERLREEFSRFGDVEDVVIKNKKRGSAIVVMANKDAAVAATGTLCGNLSNPLLVLPLQPARAAEVPIIQKSPERDDHVGGVGYQAFEDAVLEKMKMAAEKQRNEK